MSTRARSNAILRLQGVIAGLKLHQSGQTLLLDGVTITVAALIEALERYIAMLIANAAEHTTWLVHTRTARTLATTEINPRVGALVRYLGGAYGRSNSMLADYGLTPSKPATRTVKEKVTAAEKDAATRAARDTMGPQEKEAIHGTVPPALDPPPASSPVAPTVTAPAAKR